MHTYIQQPSQLPPLFPYKGKELDPSIIPSPYVQKTEIRIGIGEGEYSF